MAFKPNERAHASSGSGPVDIEDPWEFYCKGSLPFVNFKIEGKRDFRAHPDS
jgi:hypothetical protein